MLHLVSVFQTNYLAKSIWPDCVGMANLLEQHHDKTQPNHLINFLVQYHFCQDNQKEQIQY